MIKPVTYSMLLGMAVYLILLYPGLRGIEPLPAPEPVAVLENLVLREPLGASRGPVSLHFDRVRSNGLWPMLANPMKVSLVLMPYRH